jgi:hypothetical protein
MVLMSMIRAPLLRLERTVGAGDHIVDDGGVGSIVMTTSLMTAASATLEAGRACNIASSFIAASFTS